MSIKYLLDAPCVFCGYYGEGFYQSNTHKPECPWRSLGGSVEREESVRTAIRTVMAENAKLRAALEQVEWVWETREEYYCPSCNAERTDGHLSACQLKAALKGCAE